jgi:hypothetical protein
MREMMRNFLGELRGMFVSEFGALRAEFEDFSMSLIDLADYTGKKLGEGMRPPGWDVPTPYTPAPVYGRAGYPTPNPSQGEGGITVKIDAVINSDVDIELMARRVATVLQTR